MGKTIDNIAKGICIILVIFGSIAFIGILFGDMDNTSNDVSDSSPTTTSIVTIEDIKTATTPISYDELMRNSDNYVGEIVYKRGEILQVSERRTDKYVLRVATKHSEYGYYEDIIWVEYEGDRLLEGDIIDVWGESNGLETYSALFGNQVTIPKIAALRYSVHVELVTKAKNV